MPNGTLDAPATARTIVFDDEMRAVLADEANWYCGSIGDNIEHAPNGKGGRASDVLLEEAERLPLAVALCYAVENGELHSLTYLPQIVRMVSDTLRELRDELHHNSEGLQRAIVRGEDSGQSVRGPERAESIAGYHRQLAEAKEQIARCERFLELVDG